MTASFTAQTFGVCV